MIDLDADVVTVEITQPPGDGVHRCLFARYDGHFRGWACAEDGRFERRAYLDAASAAELDALVLRVDDWGTPEGTGEIQLALGASGTLAHASADLAHEPAALRAFRLAAMRIAQEELARYRTTAEDCSRCAAHEFCHEARHCWDEGPGDKGCIDALECAPRRATGLGCHFDHECLSLRCEGRIEMRGTCGG